MRESMGRVRRFLLGLPEHSPQNASPSYPTGHLLILCGLLAAAFALRMGVAILFASVHHPDETFQYWEQGYRFAFGYGMVPWEYRTGIRSYFIPGLVAGVMQFVSFLGGGMASWQLAVQALLSLLSLTVVTTAFAWGRRAGGLSAAIISGAIACVWFEVVYFAAKPLTESISTSLLFPAAYLLCVPRLSGKFLVLGGVLLGFAFIVRFQLAPAVLAIGLICLIANGWRRCLPAALAALAVIVAGGLLDWVTLGSPFQSIWLNFVVNAVEDKASSYGVEPFYWFGVSYLAVWAGFAVVMAVLALLGGVRAPVLLIVALVIVLAHSAIGHKEYRFVLPALPFLLTALGVGLADLYDRIAVSLPLSQRLASLFAIGLVICGTSLTLAQMDSYRAHFSCGANAIAAFRIAADVPGLCGIGLSGISWVHTPGYRGLGRDLPIYPLQSEAKGIALAPAFNVLIRRGGGWESLKSKYSEVECTGDLCVAVRPGTCVLESDATVNPYLVERGE